MSCESCKYCQFPRTSDDNWGACKCKAMKRKTIDVSVCVGQTPEWCPFKSPEYNIKELEKELKTYQQEYKLACAANKGLSAALDKEREENKRLRLLMFAFVRNSTILPVGLQLGKTEQEITDKTFETIAEAEKMLNVERMVEAMNLATDKENRYDRE